MNPSDYNLIEKYLDGSATPEEFAVLEGRLRADPETRLELLKESGVESQLRFLLKTAPVAYPESKETAGMTDVDECSLPQPRKAVYWRPAWLWVPVAAAAAALVAALVFPLFPAHHKTLLAGSSDAAPKRAPATMETRQFANEDAATTKEATSSPTPAAVAALSVQPSGHGAPLPAGKVVAQQGSVPDNRMSGTKPEELPADPFVVNPAAAPHAAARPMRGWELIGNIVALSRTDGSQPSAADNKDMAAPALAQTPAVAVAATTASHPDAGQVVSANGKVFLTRPTGDGKGRHVAQTGENFLPGDVIEAGPSSSILLRYADGSLVRLYSDTHLTLSQTDHNRSLFLASGAVDLRVQPLGAENNLTVCTAYIEARVVGTEFRVMTDSNGSWVGVKAGRVQVIRSRANGEMVLLEPGYFVSAAKGWPATPMQDTHWRNKCQTFTGSPRYP